jgi:hypothetical protein
MFNQQEKTGGGCGRGAPGIEGRGTEKSLSTNPVPPRAVGRPLRRSDRHACVYVCVHVSVHRYHTHKYSTMYLHFICTSIITHQHTQVGSVGVSRRKKDQVSDTDSDLDDIAAR